METEEKIQLKSEKSGKFHFQILFFSTIEEMLRKSLEHFTVLLKMLFFVDFPKIPSIRS